MAIISRDITDISEDCLYLNVWAPGKGRGALRPVMVYIHGGSFVSGSSGQECFDGESLAKQGVVVVTINYRLGPFGFLAHPLLSHESKSGVSGNYGLLDQIAALQWVQKNIAAFGGDPNCVTIFGESAGAASVCYLLVSPQAAGLSNERLPKVVARPPLFATCAVSGTAKIRWRLSVQQLPERLDAIGRKTRWPLCGLSRWGKLCTPPTRLNHVLVTAVSPQTLMVGYCQMTLAFFLPKEKHPMCLLLPAPMPTRLDH